MSIILIMGILFTLVWLLSVSFVIVYVHKKFMPKISTSKSKPFEFLSECDPTDVLEILQREQPLVIAVVLAHIEAPRAAVLLQFLPPAIQGEVTRLIAVMDRTSTEFVRGIEAMLVKRLSSTGTFSLAGGMENAVELINLVDAASEKRIVETLEDADPELADVIKKRLFGFDDIVRLDDRCVQKILRETDSQDLAKALKAANNEAQEKIFRNMSKRAAAMVREDMEYLGPIRISEAEESQQKILRIVRLLEETGEIFIKRRQDEEMV